MTIFGSDPDSYSSGGLAAAALHIAAFWLESNPSYQPLTLGVPLVGNALSNPAHGQGEQAPAAARMLFAVETLNRAELVCAHAGEATEIANAIPPGERLSQPNVSFAVAYPASTG